MYIGIDLGGTNIAAGIVKENGEIVQKLSVPTRVESGFNGIVDDMTKLVKDLLNRCDCRDEVKAIGIGIPGIADPVSGNVIACVNLNWYDVPLKQLLSEKTGLPVFLDNDATVAGVAELQVAQHGKYKNAILLTLGTGVGGFVMIDGKVISGSHGIASELGHMIIGEGLYDCNCGRNGCLETFASSTAIIHYANYLLDQGRESSILTAIEGDRKRVCGEIIFAEAKKGDALALEVVNRMVKYLAIGIMNTVCMFDPEVILLGGGISNAGAILTDSLNRELESLKYFKAVPFGKIEIAQLKNDAGIIGSGMYAMLSLLNS